MRHAKPECQIFRILPRGSQFSLQISSSTTECQKMVETYVRDIDVIVEGFEVYLAPERTIVHYIGAPYLA